MYKNADKKDTNLCLEHRFVYFVWQRMRDSNPRERSQSPVCYRYTNPLCQRTCARHGYYYTHF